MLALEGVRRHFAGLARPCARGAAAAHRAVGRVSSERQRPRGPSRHAPSAGSGEHAPVGAREGPRRYQSAFAGSPHNSQTDNVISLPPVSPDMRYVSSDIYEPREDLLARHAWHLHRASAEHAAPPPPPPRRVSWQARSSGPPDSGPGGGQSGAGSVAESTARSVGQQQLQELAALADAAAWNFSNLMLSNAGLAARVAELQQENDRLQASAQEHTGMAAAPLSEPQKSAALTERLSTNAEGPDSAEGTTHMQSVLAHLRAAQQAKGLEPVAESPMSSRHDSLVQANARLKQAAQQQAQQGQAAQGAAAFAAAANELQQRSTRGRALSVSASPPLTGSRHEVRLPAGNSSDVEAGAPVADDTAAAAPDAAAALTAQEQVQE